MTKPELVRQVIKRKATDALLLRSATMQDRNVAEVIRINARDMAEAVAYAATEEYSFLELSDAFEWKRTRVRR